MPGWTTTGNFVSGIGDPNPFALSAQDGKSFLDLTGYQTGAPFGGVTQTIATTPGKQYDLSFYLGSDTARWGGGGQNRTTVSILASAGGTNQTFTDSSATTSSTWTLETLPFTAGPGSSTAITNVDVECVNANGCAGGGGGGTGVPEPATLTLFALGMAGLGIARRRRICS